MMNSVNVHAKLISRRRLNEQVYADDREAHRQARRGGREQQQAELKYQMQREQEREHRRASCDAYGGRSDRRRAVTSANDEYLAYVQAVRE